MTNIQALYKLQLGNVLLGEDVIYVSMVSDLNLNSLTLLEGIRFMNPVSEFIASNRSAVMICLFPRNNFVTAVYIGHTKLLNQNLGIVADCRETSVENDSDIQVPVICIIIYIVTYANPISHLQRTRDVR